MEINSHVYTDLLSPLAAFVNTSSIPSHQEHGLTSASSKNPNSSWIIHGADPNGQRLFIFPRFALNKPPLRIDVIIPSPEYFPAQIRTTLDPAAIIYTPKNRLADLPICQFVLRALETWSTRISDFEAQYLSMPFGSHIGVDILTLDTADVHIEVEYGHSVEQAMLSVDELQRSWHALSSPEAQDLPEVLHWAALEFVCQLHEVISLVRVPSRHGDSLISVFKALTHDQKHMYHEIRMLLELDPHPNLIARPLYLVVRKSRFGGKMGVCGFVQEYHSRGSLGAELSARGKDIPSSVPAPQMRPWEEQFRWARQITEAILHVNAHPTGFYPDLKPDNVVLRETHVGNGDFDGVGLDAVLLDLEQRGGWFTWSPPEVAYVEYIEILARHLEDEVHQGQFRALLQAYVPDWPASNTEPQAAGGFSAAWKALLRERLDGTELADLLEKAQVFMLGKLIWCIFEGQPRVRTGVDHELMQDPDPCFEEAPVFGEFRKAPEAVRQLVHQCTQGAREWEKDGWKRAIVVRRGRLVARDSNTEVDHVLGAERTQRAASNFWESEVARAQKFLAEIVAVKTGQEVHGGILAEARARPNLEEVLRGLVNIEESLR